MNSLERCFKTINHEKPDRVPVIPQDAHVAATLAGYDMIEYSKDPKKVASAQIHLRERFGFDGIMMGADTVVLAEALGAIVEYSIHEGPRPVAGCLDSLEDVKKLKMFNPFKDGRMPVWLEAVRLMIEKIGDKFMIIGRGDQGAFSLASMLRGMQNFLMDVALDEKPQQIHELLQFCNDCTFEFMRAMKSVGAHVTTSGDSISGPDVVSPMLYEKYSLPYEIQLAEKCKKIGIPLAIHICGKTDAIFDKWISSNAEIFEIDHKTDFKMARQKTIGKICLLGNLDCSKVMFSGTPEYVELKAKEVLEIVMPDSGFILSSGCLLGGSTPTENLHALVESALKYGVYKY